MQPCTHRFLSGLADASLKHPGHTAPIEKEIRALSAALEAVKDEQEYIVTRERLHRDSESGIMSA